MSRDVEKWKVAREVMQSTSSSTRRCANCGKSIDIHEFVANQCLCTKCLMKIEQRKQAEQLQKQK
ncbi:MAG: hypothetical protein ACQXXH_04900 [Candidatus Bathyarchaeia archaeon]|jgi:uncharacterized paraquat-inducible protein A|nr:hypothetical protein [Candidatus Bathyarchaeota archaeon A05DMB-4]MDH7595072.1 hypothetical protein [Candidatus Bathyarchaeota archaeon]